MKNLAEDIISDPNARLGAQKLVLRCGVHANLKGFSRLIDAILLYGSDENLSLCELYREIAERRALKPKTVIREISYAISQSPRIDTRLSELVGSTFCSDEIHNGLVIAVLASVLKEKGDKKEIGDGNAEQHTDAELEREENDAAQM